MASDKDPLSNFKRKIDHEPYGPNYEEINVPGALTASSKLLLRRQSWPQSYDRSIGFYYRSPHALQKNDLDPIHEENRNAHQALREPLVCIPIEHSTDNNHLNSNLNNTLQATSDHSQLASPRSPHHNTRQSTFFQALLNGINTLAGVGILSMPYAIAQGGWIGLCVLFLFAIICCYTGVLLRSCIDLHPSIQGYPDIGQAAFGKFGRFITSGLLYLELFAVAVEFIIMEGDNLTKLISWRGLNLGLVQLSSQQSFMLFSALVMLPTVWLRDLSLLSYISAGGVFSSVALLVVITCVGVSDEGFKAHGEVLKIQGFPIAVGLYAFCYSGHAVFPNIYTSMKDKNRFSHVLIICFILCTLLYGTMAIVGYQMFGDKALSQVTLNLTAGRMTTKIAIAAALVNPFAKFALVLTPLAAAVEELTPRFSSKVYWNAKLWGIVIRTILVSVTVLVAIVVPFFAYVMAFVGCFLSTTVAITIPCICYMKLFPQRIPKWEWIMIVGILLVGLITTIAGTYSSVHILMKSI